MGNFTIEADFMHKGLRCTVVALPVGYRCGYVGVQKDHPLHGLDYGVQSKYLAFDNIKDDEIGKRGIIPLAIGGFADSENGTSPAIYFDVHGGITYANGGDYPVESDGLWWFGYDCAHWDDAKDFSLIEDGRIIEIEMMFPTGGTVKTLDYCIDECKSLAEQLIKITK